MTYPITRRLRRHHRTWFWCWTEHPRPVLLGPFNTQYEANQCGYRDLQGVFEVVELPTCDRARATQILKYRKLGQTHNIETSLERIRHKL